MSSPSRSKVDTGRRGKGPRIDVARFIAGLERQGARIDDAVRAVLTESEGADPFAVLTAVSSRTALHRKQLYRAFADGLGLPFVDMDWIRPDPTLLRLLPIEDWRRHAAFPLSKLEQSVEVALADPFDLRLAMLLEQRHGLRVTRMLALPEQVDIYLAEQQVEVSDLQQALEGMTESDLRMIAEQLSRGATEAIEPFAEQILALAKKQGASDIHLETMEHEARLRLRLDGNLREVLVMSAEVARHLIGYFKVAGNLDIAERRLPQDGRITGRIGHSAIDLRVSTVPTIYGEKMVLRLLDDPIGEWSLPALGFSPRHLQPYRDLLQRPHGLILVTGPTGSGKTTTLYASLSEISDPSRNVITIEDPVEYRLGGVNQIQVQPKIGLDFPRVLRASLRQDPDVILVGEIRDAETASIAVQAALTGHLVLSTLHTNTALDAVVRLIDIGVPSYLVAEAIVGVLAQRLVRRLCEHCRQPYPAGAELCARLGTDATELLTFYEPGGCAECGFTGYRGRMPVHELFTVDDDVRRAIAGGEPLSQWRRLLKRSGYRPLSFDALTKAMQGLTTIDEVLRVHVHEKGIA
ncbi:MAG: GspE/PulE family protein [Planctomycetota bacterium]|jgi:type IV pilus assembly protein PilB|nr:GspE/PulE family protein [Planctomycetota bacterium]